MMRASEVVKRQSTRIPSWLRCCCHAPAAERFGWEYGGLGVAGPAPRFRSRPSLRQAQDRIQPTALLGRVVNLQPLGDAPRFGWPKRLVQRGRMLGVQVVHHQHNPVFVSIVHVHQLLDHSGPIGFRAPVRNFNPAPPFQRREQHEQVARPIALVFVIVGARRSKPGRTLQPGLFHLLFAGLVQADQNFVVPILALIDFQHVFHRADKLRTASRRDAPALFQPGLEFVF